MKFFISLLTLLLCHVVFAQGEANNWYFGNNAGIKFNDDGSVTPLSGGQIITTEGCSTISNAEGQLLFYTDGRDVWDRNGTKMPNGNYFGGTGLLGDPSSTQSAIIVPNRADPNIYYIFTVDEPHHQNAAVYPNRFNGVYDGADRGTVPQADDGFNNGLNYSVVDLSVTGTNGSVGDVTTRNVHLVTYDPTNTDELSYKCSEKISAVKTTDGTGFWVITQFIDNFYAFKVDATGVNTTPVVTNTVPLIPTGGYRRNSIGYLKASPDGKKLAIAHNQIGTFPGQEINNGVVYIYDFDAATGTVSNPIEVSNNVTPYGIEFSREAKKLYVSYGGGAISGVWQYDMLSANITASGVQVGFTGNTSGALQLGPNGKIYKTKAAFSLDVINNPEADGTACDYVNNAQAVAGQATLGLPPFITSLLVTNTTNTCDTAADGDDTNGQALTDLNTVTPQILPSNQFTVKYYASIADAQVPRNELPLLFYNTTPNKQIIYARVTNIPAPANFGIVPVTINVIPVPAPPAAPVTLVQCDLGVAPDGLTTFNLRQADAQLTGGVTGVTVRYFTSAAIAQTGSGELGDLFTNTANPQVITARIENAATGCYRLEQVTLQATFSPRPQVTLEECDDDGNEDGLRQFNLDDAGVATGTETVVYYTSENDALAELNPIPALFTTTVANQQTVFARIENNNDCIAIQQIQLIVRRMPNINTVGEALVCLNTNEFITLTNGLPGSTTGYAFEWSTLETTPTIRVNKPGVYTVKVTDMTNTAGCSKLRTITVTASDIARITDINIQDLQRNNIVTVTAVPNNAGVVTTYLYSIDAPNGPYQASNVFENVTAGMHTVYVYDDNGCGVVHQDISVLEIPKFFTPNADGINDTWNIIGVNALFYAKSKIYVFDRFGKLLADVDPRGLGWDGQHDGRRLPATDYWYVVELDNGRTVKGHFSLIR